MTLVVPALLASASTAAAVVGVHRSGIHRLVARRLVACRPIGRSPQGRALGGALERAGVPVGADAFVVLTALAATVVALLAWSLVRAPVVAAVAGTGVVGAAWGFVSSADQRYLGRFSAQLPVVAQQLAGALGAGQSLRQAITRAAIDAPEPAATELRRVSTDLALGARIETALEAIVARLPDTGLRIMVTAILVQRVVGGNLSQALADLSARLDERAALERETRSATAQARMSAWLVAGLPLAGGVLVEIASPGTLARTIGQGPGLALLVGSTSLQIAGVLIIRRIVRRDGLGA